MRRIFYILCAGFIGLFISFNALCWSVTKPAEGAVDKQVAVLYVATGRYIHFWDGFYAAAEKYFLPDIKKTYFVFTDDVDKVFPANVVRVYQKQLDWPGPTLRRYHFFNAQAEVLSQYRWLFFFNANLMPLRDIGREVLPDSRQKLMFCQHPGYYTETQNPDSIKSVPYERRKKSVAEIPYGTGQFYVAGGFNGGLSGDFLAMAAEIARRVDADDARGVGAAWHDESHINRYLLDLQDQGEKPLILSASYLVPQEAVFSKDKSYYRQINAFKAHPHMIILNKKWYGGHQYLRGQVDEPNEHQKKRKP